MATTTTNFGWDIPQSTDLVKDGATAIATLGQDIDTALVDLKGGTTGQVLAKNSNTDLDFTWVAQDDSNAIQNAIVDAKGDLISATAADTPARLAVGTNGQVLTVDSTTSTGLKWATPAGGGKVLQVVSTNTSTVTTTTSGSYVDVTNLSASITPAATSSKILVLVEMQVSVERDNYPNCGVKLLRGSTVIATKEDFFTSNQGSTSPNGIPKFVVSAPIMYLDSPSTTSSTTYKMQISILASGVNGTVSANGSIFGGNPRSSITLLEIGA